MQWDTKMSNKKDTSKSWFQRVPGLKGRQIMKMFKKNKLHGISEADMCYREK